MIHKDLSILGKVLFLEKLVTSYSYMHPFSIMRIMIQISFTQNVETDSSEEKSSNTGKKSHPPSNRGIIIESRLLDASTL